jgi:glucarate dehydratase
MAKAADVPLYKLVGGEEDVASVPVAAYAFYREPAQDGSGAVGVDTMVEHMQSLVDAYGFQTVKLKAGVHRPAVDLEVLAHARQKLGRETGLRIDPNGSYSMATALRMLPRLEDIDLEYFEEPVRGRGPEDSSPDISALKRLRAASRVPIAVDHAYRLDLLAQVVRSDCADVALDDLFGARSFADAVAFVRLASEFGLGVSLHSGAETCLGQAAKVHLHAAFLQEIRYAQDAIYPEYLDSYLDTGRLAIKGGRMLVPPNSGLGVTVSGDKLEELKLTQEKHRRLDEQWRRLRARLGLSLPAQDMLVRHF